VGENCLIFFFGTDRVGHEVRHMLVPPAPIPEFTYGCSRRFEVERFAPLFAPPAAGHALFISGEQFLLYRFDGAWRRLKAGKAAIGRRQSKGGQSSIRFSHPTGESRDAYVAQVVDHVNQPVTPGLSNYVFGRRELKARFPALRVAFRTTREATLHAPYFRAPMTAPLFGEERRVEEIVALLDRSGGHSSSRPKKWLPTSMLSITFSVSELREDAERLFPAGSPSGPKPVIVLPAARTRYAKLRSFPLVAKLYPGCRSLAE
jgi:hypothetical protein